MTLNLAPPPSWLTSGSSASSKPALFQQQQLIQFNPEIHQTFSIGRRKQANETYIAEAVNSVKSGLKIRHAAETYSMPYSTLRNRLRSTLPIHQAKISSQLLSPEQEEALVDIIL